MTIRAGVLAVRSAVSKLVEFLNFETPRVSTKLDEYEFEAISHVSRVVSTKPAFLIQFETGTL
jgi:hypothetical protein